MKYYLSRAVPSVRARAWAGVVLLPIAHVPRRLYVAPLHGVLNGSVAVHADLLLLEALGEVVLGIARLPRVRAGRLAEVGLSRPKISRPFSCQLHDSQTSPPDNYSIDC